jgi:hypothetical protein
MDFQEFYDVGRLLCSEKIDDFRHIEFFTRDLVDKSYDYASVLSQVKCDKKAMQKLGFVCEIAMEYASAIAKNNQELDKLYRILNTWRERSVFDGEVFLTETDRSLCDLVKSNTNPKAAKWGVVSDYSSVDFKKFHKVY